ncbi:antitoxin Xre/MbcA/ParS toxin-binding domain-containing protein [Nissabacter sp. SGAir0207]|uniref:type II RES/Xre toxin-antitoxin system antitoxin n=1 Tax=Nissabacter sp. SGAir0207 TaxID=2126321 RepID=UPI0010CCBD2C|nr:antitoxin Xre/MbcA/ParS toxin-binding domain-containing protein [Nissabacter sp. SGAir0207]QCR36168.1 toxin-antitoxin system antitoxin component [Nissabacter sp. SGAir0207]
MRAYIPTQPSQDHALWRFAGLPGDRGRALISALQAGLPVEVLESIRDWSSMSQAEILRIAGINERNIARRKQAGSTLSADESERIARLVRVFDAAVQLFGGDKQEAGDWLRSPVKGLGQVSPLSLIATESGAIEVLDLIGRLEHGVIA